MNKLLVGAWAVFVLDLVVLVLMVRELLTVDFSEADRAFATSVIWVFALWLCLVNLVIVVSWWRDSRGGLWAALALGGLPLLWAWTRAVQAITDAATAPQ